MPSKPCQRDTRKLAQFRSETGTPLPAAVRAVAGAVSPDARVTCGGAAPTSVERPGGRLRTAATGGRHAVRRVTAHPAGRKEGVRGPGMETSRGLPHDRGPNLVGGE